MSDFVTVIIFTFIPKFFQMEGNNRKCRFLCYVRTVCQTEKVSSSDLASKSLQSIRQEIYQLSYGLLLSVHCWEVLPIICKKFYQESIV